ncbi:MAG: endonuclease domain-containing protein [Nitrospirae bacterium]|nr:endonuclease domain-containing protein [Nitrospirota bacterium]
MKIKYNPELKELALQLRNNSTKAEINLWHYIKGRQLMGYDFHRQKPIGNWIVDFFCNKLMLAIELDGYTHSFEEVFKKDKEKEQSLQELGITILRFKDEDVMNNVEGVLEHIEEYIKSLENKHTPLSPLNRGEA